MAMVTNWANVSNASAPPTSVLGPWSVMSSHSTIASTPAAPAAAAVTAAYSPRGHVRCQRADEQQEQRGADEHEDRREREPLDLGPDERLGAWASTFIRLTLLAGSLVLLGHRGRARRCGTRRGR